MKKQYIMGIILVVLVLGGIGAYQYYQHSQYEKAISKQVTTIQNKYKQASAEKASAKKLADLKQLQKDLVNYTMKKEKDKRVIKAYKQAIAQLVSDFKAKNDQVLKDNTSDISKEVNQEVLKTKINHLNQLLTTVKAQKDIVYQTTSANQRVKNTENQKQKSTANHSKSEYTQFVEEIQNAIHLYNEKIAEIQAAEQQKAELAKRKAEEERKNQERQRIEAQKAQAAKMNFEEIKNCNFQSIQGKWQAIVAAINYHNGQGYVWQAIDTPNYLDISQSQISGKFDMMFGEFALNSNGLTTSQSTNLPTTFSVREGVLVIDSTDGGTAWSLSFHPKEVEIEKNRPDEPLPESIHSNTEHITVRASGIGGPSVVYERIS